MRNFMRQRTGKLRLVTHAEQEPGRDVDLPAGRRARVRQRRFKNRKPPWQVRPLGMQRDPAANLVHIPLDAVVAVQRCGAEYTRHDVLAQFYFFLLGHFLLRVG